MSKLNSKLYKSKMSEENKKSSENIDVLYSNQVQVENISLPCLQNQFVQFQTNPSGEDLGFLEKMLPGRYFEKNSCLMNLFKSQGRMQTTESKRNDQFYHLSLENKQVLFMYIRSSSIAVCVFLSWIDDDISSPSKSSSMLFMFICTVQLFHSI